MLRAKREQSSALTVYDSEDTFIDCTALGHVMVNDSLSASGLHACTAEVLVKALLSVLEASEVDSLPQMMQSLSKARRCLTLQPPMAAQPVELASESLKTLVTTLPMLLHPVIIIRLLMHRLFACLVRKSNVAAKLTPHASQGVRRHGVAVSSRYFFLFYAVVLF